jgi:tellurite resistance protein
MSRPLRSRGRLSRLDADNAFIALVIAAMDASGHVSAEEAARAHNIIWSTRRFRHRDGDDVGRRIERTKTLIEEYGAAPVIEAGARKIPKRLRPAAFAVAADIVLVDGRMERAEGRFLRQLASDESRTACKRTVSGVDYSAAAWADSAATRPLMALEFPLGLEISRGSIATFERRVMRSRLSPAAPRLLHGMNL